MTSLILAGCMWASRAYWISWFERIPPEDTYGPFDVDGAWRDVCAGLLHTAVISLVGFAVLRVRALHRWATPAAWFVLITAIDLTVANGWLIATVPASRLEALPHGAAWADVRDKNHLSETVPARVVHQSGGIRAPAVWANQTNSQRLQEVIAWEQRTLLRKHHLLQHINVIDSPSTIHSADLQALLAIGHRAGATPTSDRGAISDKAAPPTFEGSDLSLWQALGVEQLVVDRSWSDRSDRTIGSPVQLAEEAAFGFQPVNGGMPRVWCANYWQPAPIADGRTRSSLHHAMRKMWFDNELNVVDLRTTISVDAPVDPPREIAYPPVDTQETAEIVSYESQRIEIDVLLDRPGLLVMSDLYFPGWTAVRRSSADERATSCEIVRVNGLFRGVALPAGRHQVELRYQPWSFRLGAMISLFTSVCVLLAWWSKRAVTSGQQAADTKLAGSRQPAAGSRRR
jgi:hypothetical protein